MVVLIYFYILLFTSLSYNCFITAGNLHLKVPQVVTGQVLSSDTLTALSTSPYKNNVEEVDSLGSSMSERNGSSCENCCKVPSLVLAGLHACGDLSVSMLRSIRHFYPIIQTLLDFNFKYKPLADIHIYFLPISDICCLLFKA